MTMNDDGLPGARSAARIAAVQALYQMEISEEAADDITAEFVEFRFGRENEVTPGEPDAEFFSDIVHGVPARQQEIDKEIAKCLAKNWRLSRVDSLLRAIMRAGAYEILARRDVPAKVVIDEYVSLTHIFEAEDGAPFINAALDKLAHLKRPEEFGGEAPDDQF
nr:transcription antitermination factor NusB [Rhizomicrobium electricum]